jgi:hypothetical protein
LVSVSRRALPQWYIFVYRSFLPQAPSYTDIIANMSGMIINHNDAWEVPRPYPRTFVNVLGMNIDKKPKPLPKVRIGKICG